MKVMMRFGSAWHDVAAQIQAVTREGLDPRHFLLVTDDSHSETLVRDGHMDRVVRHAIGQGAPPITVLQMATLNTAEHFGVARDVGQIAPGRFADLVLVSDLDRFEAETVVARGQVAAEGGRLLLDLPPFSYPGHVKASVHLARPLRPEDFVLRAPAAAKVRAHVIGVIENQAPTRHLEMVLEPQGGEIRLHPGADLAKVALVERHKASGRIQVGLVSGFGFKERCAFGSTVAHDSHHMLLVGTDEASMAVAGNELARVGGGQVVVRDGRATACVELPIAGLMSDNRAEIVAEKARRVLEAIRDCGCALNNANMQLSLLALVVIPELRISDLGLVDVSSMSLIPVAESVG
jgi:adenine deaminase